MDYESMSKEQLLSELSRMRRRIEEFEVLENRRKHAESRLDTERKRLFNLLDGLPAFVYLQAPDYSIRFANRNFRECFGEPWGRPCYEVVNAGKEPCKECLTFRVFATKTPQKWEWTMLDGRIYQIYDYPFFDIDGSPLVLELGIEITEQKLLEKTRSELFTNVSHELRTPLMKIQGYVEALRDGVYKDENEFRQYLEIIYHNTSALNRLINDLFDLSQLEAKQSMKFAKVELAKILLQYFEETTIFLEQKGIRFTYLINEALPSVEIDIDRIIQVLDNLLENARKFTQQDGAINIAVTPHAKGVLIEVADDGQGIPESELPYVFTRFFKGMNSKILKAGKGTGLGLAIVKAIIEAHQGTIWVESKPHKGTKFSFIIPQKR